MDNRPPIERVRDREMDAQETFDDARETLAQKQANLDKQAPQDAPNQEPAEDFEERMQEKLKDSGKDDESSTDSD